MTDIIETPPVAQRIALRMEAVGLANNYQLAKKAGISRAVLTNIWRRPDKQLWADIALKLSRTLQCRLEWLLTGDGPITDEAAAEFERLYGDSPVMKLSELATSNLEQVVSEARYESNRTGYHCPLPSSTTTVAIKTGRKLGRFDEETILFMDLEKKVPTSGQIVLARPVGGGVPEFYTYSTSMGKQFLKAMTDDLPDNLKFIEMGDDVEILGCFVSAILI